MPQEGERIKHFNLTLRPDEIIKGNLITPGYEPQEFSLRVIAINRRENSVYLYDEVRGRKYLGNRREILTDRKMGFIQFPKVADIAA